MKTYSLRGRLTAWLLVSLVGLWCVAALFTYIEAREEVDELADLRLLQVARAYSVADSEQLRLAHKAQDAQSPANAADRQPDDDEGFGPPLFQRFDRTGRLLSADGQPRDTAFDPRAGLSEVTVAGLKYHSATVWRDGVQTRVFEPEQARTAAAGSVLRRMLVPLAAGLPLLVFLIWSIVGRGLGLLSDLAHGVEGRDAVNLAPLDAPELPEEAAPLVMAVNRLLARLNLVIDQERRFTADAAHELRTPLSGLKLHAQVALGSTDPVERRDALTAIVGGVDRATHLFEQLLMLSRADRGESLTRTPVDLSDIAARVAQSFRTVAAGRRIELGIHTARGLRMMAAPVLVDALVRNLIDNAIRYSPDGSRVEVVTTAANRECVVRVRDDGPGIEPEQRVYALERFTRLSGQDVPGSGLGLSIVARIVRSHHGTLTLDAGIDGRGLEVRAAFPMLEDDDAEPFNASSPRPFADASRSPA